MKSKFYILLLFLISFSQLYSQNVSTIERDVFVKNNGATVVINKATNNISFIKFPVSKNFKIPGDTPEEKALLFMNQNGALFSSKKNQDTHIVKETKKNIYGLDNVVLQQYYKGVKVFDGILKFHFNKMGEISSMNGNFIKTEKLNPNPTILKIDAEKLALKMVTGQKLDAFIAPLKVHKSQLLVFQKGLAQGIIGTKHLVYEVEVRNDDDIREFLYIDAHSKELVEQFAGIHNIGLERKLYEGSYSSISPNANLVWKEGDNLPGALNNFEQSEIETSGQMYKLMKHTFGHGSYNGGATINDEAPMITVNNATQYTNCLNNPNASWNGITTNFCENIASDDIVGHEWAHAYTEYTSGLIYSYQAGALNEAYSDIWGETLDQINGYFDVGENNGVRSVNGNCSDTDRWLLGESTALKVGLFRDMYNPTCFDNPGKVTDNLYWCSSADNGGVHINSGVINHLYALLVDGGTYNGQVINGIGLTKSAHLFWYVQSELMTATTDFTTFADQLDFAMQAIISSGANLNALSTSATSTSASGQFMVASDAIELTKAILAVELRTVNECNFSTILQPVAAICNGGLPSNAIFFENFENGLNNFTPSSTTASGTFTPRNWVSKASAVGSGRTSLTAYAVDFAGDNCNFLDESGIISLTSPNITIPLITSGDINLAFDHSIFIEDRWDGGNIKISKDNGITYEIIPASAFFANPYNNAIFNSNTQQNTNPMASEPAFTGSDAGQTLGKWGQSRINLTSLGVVPGGTVKLKWDLGTDGCGGEDGWYIDDVTIYSCAQPTVQFTNTSTIVNEAEANVANLTPNECFKYIEKTVEIKINKAPSENVTVNLVASGTAIIGSINDFTISPASFTFTPGGPTTQNIIIKIFNDGYVENVEEIILNYNLTTTGDAISEAYNHTHILTINDNDLEPGSTRVDLIAADINTSFPTGWSVFDNLTNAAITSRTYPSTWARVSFTNLKLDPKGKPFVMLNSDAAGQNSIFKQDQSIITAPFNTLGLSNLTLEFDEFFKVYDDPTFNTYAEFASVEAWDGTTWHSIFMETEADGTSGSWADPAHRTINIPIAYNNSAMKLRFRYSAEFDYWWALDNIKVIGNLPTQVQSNTNIAEPASQYLGPFGNAVFYDPTSGNILAKIQNLSSFDFGCTTVEVDRIGNGETNWFGTYKISNKTFKVTPTNQNPMGQYKITLYYTANEVVGLTGTSIGKSADNISNSSTGLFAEFDSGNIFNTDYYYSATFNSGFSGFGISSAPAIGPLPVNLISFTGKNVAEGNQLNWNTSSETNNESFIIERSDNAKDFKSIGQVRGNGTTSEKNNYSYLDSQFEPGLNYYRLKQLDFNGKYGYSNTIVIETKSNIKYIVSPNPVSNQLNIDVPAAIDGIIELKILTVNGTEIINKKVKVKYGKIVENLTNFASGSYIVILKTKNRINNFKIIKQ